MPIRYLAVAELSVQWKFITLGLLGPGTNTELGSGANEVCLVVTELGVQWKFIYFRASQAGYEC